MKDTSTGIIQICEIRNKKSKRVVQRFRIYHSLGVSPTLMSEYGDGINIVVFELL